MSISSTALSRVVSHALRHEPWLYELELDDEGWVDVEQLLDALHAKGPEWSTVDRDDLLRMIAASSKRRHEVRGDRIRALYGHSLPGVIRRTSAQPPARLFHGTSPTSLAKIREIGLQPMGRQYVHLSVDIETARAVGARKSPCPIVLNVDAAGAYAAGVHFYAGNEMVWLADRVPPSFVTIVQDQ